MESVYIIVLWLIGIALVVIGLYVPGLSLIVWLGAVTLAFGALLAFRREF